MMNMHTHPSSSLIIGSSGQVAQALFRELSEVEGQNPIRSSRKPSNPGDLEIDLADQRSIRAGLRSFWTRTPPAESVIFLPGAWTHVDGCEQDPARCFLTNTEGARIVAELVAEAGAHLVFFSSEYVFGAAEYRNGATGPFSENDAPDPCSVYGESKAKAEQAIMDAGLVSRATIVRTTVVYSWRAQDMNFPMQLRRYLQDCISGKSGLAKFRIPVDQITTPTYAADLAQATVALAKKRTAGIWHVCGRDRLSRAEFTEKLAQAFGFEWKHVRDNFHLAPTKELGQIARRPLSAGLNTDKAVLHGLRIGTLAEALTALPTSALDR